MMLTRNNYTGFPKMGEPTTSAQQRQKAVAYTDLQGALQSLMRLPEADRLKTFVTVAADVFPADFLQQAGDRIARAGHFKERQG